MAKGRNKSPTKRRPIQKYFAARDKETNGKQGHRETNQNKDDLKRKENLASQLPDLDEVVLVSKIEDLEKKLGSTSKKDRGKVQEQIEEAKQKLKTMKTKDKKPKKLHGSRWKKNMKGK